MTPADLDELLRHGIPDTATVRCVYLDRARSVCAAIDLPELIRLARRGMRAEAETCRTCAERKLHGSVHWCSPMAGRRDDDGYCDAWRAKEGG